MEFASFVLAATLLSSFDVACALAFIAVRSFCSVIVDSDCNRLPLENIPMTN
jgi:hypothetical protein